MYSSNASESELMKAVLQPLLNDFKHWFGRSINLLESEAINFLSEREQEELLSRVRQAQQLVIASQSLSQATGNQAGVDMSVVMSWHQLVHECWNVGIRFRQQKAQAAQDNLNQDN
ncbi:DUF2605 domain-containing protein [Leptothoe sp. PORK10 BA2]|jgi:hypothetical protein|uniref:DUF2605 domain-containing protein n=1 Tax=Leptothoe sp. PORK10 BA2 TaxID=3110254 RepID=UPI002B1FC679|nr:DUF2605 domain-containing protein [Leptothoe sp. PORK10 BA2]MEA5462824.1 DUF2605 domain-containing protein [Leptothoe sp. PORK10 BA2]